MNNSVIITSPPPPPRVQKSPNARPDPSLHDDSTEDDEEITVWDNNKDGRHGDSARGDKVQGAGSRNPSKKKLSQSDMTGMYNELLCQHRVLYAKHVNLKKKYKETKKENNLLVDRLLVIKEAFTMPTKSMLYDLAETSDH